MTSDSPQCRICLLDLKSVTTSTVVRPCLCKGSIQYVHQRCLKKWILKSRRLTCQVCLYKYQLCTHQETYSTIAKRLANRKTAKRLYQRAILYGIWLFFVWMLLSKFISAYYDCETTGRCAPLRFTQPNCTAQNATNLQPPQPGCQAQFKILVPLFFYSLLSFSVFYLMLRYTQFIARQLGRDYRWCRRLRSHKRFLNYPTQAGDQCSIYNLNELVTSNSM